jgi:hypothetical protein
VEQDIIEVRSLETKDGKIFKNRVEAEKHTHLLKVKAMRAEFVKYAEKLLDDLLDQMNTNNGYHGSFVESDYDGVLSFDDVDDVVAGAMTIVDLWDGRFLKLIKHIEKEIRKV